MSFFRRLLKKDEAMADAESHELQLGPPEPELADAGDAAPAGSYVGIVQTPGSPALDDDWNSGTPASSAQGGPALDDDWNNKDGSSSQDGAGEFVDSNPVAPMDGAILVVSAADGPMPNEEDDLPDELSGDPSIEAVAGTGAIIGVDFNYEERTTLLRLDPTDLRGDGSMLVGFNPAESLDPNEPNALLDDDDQEHSAVEELPDL